MEEPVRISVITAVYNRESTIADTMKSVSEQRYPHVEHIIQDGASSDSTLDIIQSYCSSRVNVESTQDAGIYDAINKGIDRCDGDIIGLMHSDDVFACRDVLSEVAVAFKNPDVDGVYGDLDYVASNDVSKVVRCWRSGSYNAKRLSWGWMPPHPTLYLRRKIFHEWGGYDTDFQIAADYDAILRYLVRGNIVLKYIPKIFVKMRLGGESNRCITRIIRKSYEDYRALRRNKVGGLVTLSAKNLSKLGQFL